jgi:asparagine synthase (glutamine-hydrolysing)
MNIDAQQVNFSTKVSRIVLSLDRNLWKIRSRSSDGALLVYRFLCNPLQETVKSESLPFVFLCEDLRYIKISSGIIRQAPIFYKVENGVAYITDDPNRLIAKNIKLNLRSLMEFLSFGYVLSNRTLLEGIYTLQAGEVLEFKDETLKIYDNFLYDALPISNLNKKELKERLWTITVLVFKDLLKQVKGKTVVVPLSSGLDSRFIVSMFKFLGFNDVICINYGVKGNYETPISKMVADRLGYEWLFIEYSKDRFIQLFQSNDFANYIRTVHAYHVTPNIQEFLSTSFLKEKFGDKDLIFIPGHTGDFISGGHITKRVLSAVSVEDVAEAILQKHYMGLRGFPYSLQVTNDVVLYLNDYLKKSSNILTAYQLYEIFDWRERQSKYVSSFNKVYEYFNFSWSIPLWDKRFFDFWSAVPLKLKYNKKLYREFLAEYVFAPLGIDFEKRAQKAYALPNFARMVVGNLLEEAGFIKKVNPCGFDTALPYLTRFCQRNYSKSFSSLCYIKESYGIRGYNEPAVHVTDFTGTLILDDLNKITGGNAI